MAAPECQREADLLEALQTSAWPDCCTEDLRRHVDGCPVCRDILVVAWPLLGEQQAAAAEARVPAAATVWWRMQLRARREAERRAMQPISVWQGLALATGVGLVLAAVSFVSPSVQEIAGALSSPVPGGGAAAPATLGTFLLSPFGVLTMTAALVLVVVPLAVFLAVRGD